MTAGLDDDSERRADELVTIAQRTYGVYLTRDEFTPATGPLTDARAAYAAVLESAGAGSRAAVSEILRILHEPEAVADLALDPVEIVSMLDEDSALGVFDACPWTVPDLRRVSLLKGVPSSILTAAQSRIADDAIETGNLSALGDLADAGVEAVRERSRVALCESIEIAFIELLQPSAQIAPSPWLHRVTELLELLERIDREGENALSESVAALRIVIRIRVREVERRDLAARFETLWKNTPTDLRCWNADLEHLCLRARRWISEEADGHRKSELEQELQRALKHGRTWGMQHAKRPIRTDQLLHALRSDGSAFVCQQCLAWSHGSDRYCTQCGSRVVAPPIGQEVASSTDGTAASVLPPLPESHPERGAVSKMPPPTPDAPLSGSSAAFCLGDQVAFRSLAKADRLLHSAPNPASSVLQNYVVGRCSVVDIAGDWVQIRHSSGTTGWVQSARLRFIGRSGTEE